MRNIVVRLALVFALLIPTYAHAYYFSGQDIHRGLKLYDGKLSALSDSELFDALIAAGFVGGVFDTLDKLAFEAPPNLQRATMTAVVLKWLDDHPATWTSPASVLVMMALVDAWGTDEQRANLAGMRELVGAGEK